MGSFENAIKPKIFLLVNEESSYENDLAPLDPWGVISKQEAARIIYEEAEKVKISGVVSAPKDLLSKDVCTELQARKD